MLEVARCVFSASGTRCMLSAMLFACIAPSDSCPDHVYAHWPNLVVANAGTAADDPYNLVVAQTTLLPRHRDDPYIGTIHKRIDPNLSISADPMVLVVSTHLICPTPRTRCHLKFYDRTRTRAADASTPAQDFRVY